MFQAGREMWSGKGAVKLQPANVYLDASKGKRAYRQLGDTASQTYAIGTTVWSFGAAVKLSNARAKTVPAQLDDPVNQLELMPYMLPASRCTIPMRRTGSASTTRQSPRRR